MLTILVYNKWQIQKRRELIMVDTVYTIGYSGFSIDDFVATLKSNHISLVIDVRSQPYSQWYSDYNEDVLGALLKHEGIYYRSYASEFGARQEDSSYYSPEGYLDFEKFAKSPQFLQGYEKLVKSMKQDYRFALMCAEKDPFNCHRAILVARAFHDAGYKVIHLMPNDLKITQEEIEQRLLEEYFPDRDQINLFAEPLDDDEYVIQAYRKRNSEIGYSIEEENK
jgi:uncharacterized protein (DUF488 family)